MTDPLMPPERGPKKPAKPAPPANPPAAAPQAPPPAQPLYVARAVSVPKTPAARPAPQVPAQQVPTAPTPAQSAPAKPVPKAVPQQPAVGYPQPAPPAQQVPAARPVPLPSAQPSVPMAQPAPQSFPLAQAAPPRAAPAPNRAAPASSAGGVAPIDGQQFHWEMQKAYAGIRPWLWFIGIVGLLTGMLMLSGVCVVLYASGGQMVAPVVIGCLVILITASVMMYASYFMFRYASRIGEYLYGGTRYWLEMTLDAERSMWRFFGVLAILSLVISIMAIVLLLAGALVAAGMGASNL